MMTSLLINKKRKVGSTRFIKIKDDEKNNTTIKVIFKNELPDGTILSHNGIFDIHIKVLCPYSINHRIALLWDKYDDNRVNYSPIFNNNKYNDNDKYNYNNKFNRIKYNSMLSNIKYNNYDKYDHYYLRNIFYNDNHHIHLVGTNIVIFTVWNEKMQKKKHYRTYVKYMDDNIIYKLFHDHFVTKYD